MGPWAGPTPPASWGGPLRALHTVKMFSLFLPTPVSSLSVHWQSLVIALSFCYIVQCAECSYTFGKYRTSLKVDALYSLQGHITDEQYLGHADLPQGSGFTGRANKGGELWLGAPVASGTQLRKSRPRMCGTSWVWHVSIRTSCGLLVFSQSIQLSSIL